MQPAQMAEAVHFRPAIALAAGPRTELQRDTMLPTGEMADATGLEAVLVVQVAVQIPASALNRVNE